MSKKKLLSIPKTQGGFAPEPVKKVMPVAKTKLVPYVDQRKLDYVEYKTVAEYAQFVKLPVEKIYGLIFNKKIESMKINNILHVVIKHYI